MAFDIALDGESGDVIFGPTRDLLGATGDGLTKQRILLRCKVPRGSWVYDEDGTLGSRLYTISASASAAQLQQAPAYVREAVEPMDDIQLTDVSAVLDDQNRIVVAVDFINVIADDEIDASPIEDDQLPGIETTFTV